MSSSEHDDHVARVRAQWAEVWPELDTSPMAIVARTGRLARFFDQSLEQFFIQYDIRREIWDVLASLRRSGAPYRASPTTLYRGLMRTSGAMTNRLHRLEQTSLIRRVRDPQDGRGLLVELTENGLDLVSTVAPAHMDNERRLLDALTPAERQTLARLLSKLLAAREAAEGPDAGPPRD